MIASVFKRGLDQGRAGAWGLSLLATSPNTAVLRGLAEGPGSVAELQERSGSPGSTLRARLKDLADGNVIAVRRARGSSYGAAEYELTEAGVGLLVVAEILESWLSESPRASRSLGGSEAKAAIGALVESWSATLLRALAARPLSIADLDSLIGSINYPALERRIVAMRLAGQVEARPAHGRETPYAVTSWLRHGVAPLLATIRWERRYFPGDSVPVAGLDFETTFLLALPLLELGDGLAGTCRLVVELPAGGEKRLAGVLASVGKGSVLASTSRLTGETDAWASGSVSAWFHALMDRDTASLELGGDGHLAHAVVTGLQRALFAPSAPRRGAIFAWG